MAATRSQSHVQDRITRPLDSRNDAQVDLLRGTEKYSDPRSAEEGTTRKSTTWLNEPYRGTAINDTPSSLAEDVSSSAVLTQLDGDGLVERGNWSGRFDFLMSLLGYSVGLGNVWRFPYLAYSNGGGAFLFPFILMLILIGTPLMFMELAFGQFASLGPAAIFDRFCPLFHGLGIAMICVSSLVAVYYTVIIAWTILYLFMSFTSELPWESCGEEWKTQFCYTYKEADACAKINGSVYYNQTCFNATYAASENIVELAKNSSIRHVPAQDFFERHVLNISSGIEHLGDIRWQVVLCLLCAWTLTFFSLSKGVKSTGKVVYFTALFPYVVLCILFVRGVTLPGSLKGIIFYVTPEFHLLKSAKVWKEAAVQIFFSLSPAWGGLITLASYNKFHNNCYKDALIVSIGNICTSIFAGFVIFSIIGYLANELDMPVDKVVDQGAGLAFIVYPDVVTRLPISPLWSFLFFFMLLTLGMGSEFALLETIMTAVQDLYPALRQKKTWVVLTVCILGFLSGLTVCTDGGMYILQLMDSYAASWAVFLMAIIECVLIGWVHGAQEFIIEVELMIGQRSRNFHKYFSIFWKYISPATLTLLMVFNAIQYEPLEYDTYVYPGWANAIGWLMALAPIMMIIAIAVFRLLTTHRDLPFKKRVKELLKHTSGWGPNKFQKAEEEENRNRTIENPNFTVGNPQETRI
ncbi:sodium-dependent proline transporter isoform X1 [Octopus bimaculoides]|uniref:sodium-dependent proline transporter isoform X1 n=1 Tax=Octopus bimaculoides TaxID=37653 RepID=UPI00071E0C9B|nr:sodium-dependent proline transporter isoform X1 [Octopus bimaculoides]|eukprot:XP_014772306.1 PREDICTED: sodium-dependent proline transporter-like isoform X1 [Octopus bimaculoides]